MPFMDACFPIIQKNIFFREIFPGNFIFFPAVSNHLDPHEILKINGLYQIQFPGLKKIKIESYKQYSNREYV